MTGPSGSKRSLWALAQQQLPRKVYADTTRDQNLRSESGSWLCLGGVEWINMFP